MDFNRIHILGAPGSGVTTLGENLAAHLQVPHFDTDDYYWIRQPDGLNYRRKRNPDHRRALLAPDLENNSAWVLSGALCGWGDVFIPLFDLVIFIQAPKEIRAERIAKREAGRYGTGRISENGDLFEVYKKFQKWAMEYDDRSEGLRSLSAENGWLKTLHCPVIVMDGTFSEQELMKKIIQRMKGLA